jgi:hypothetical protein
MVIDDICVLHLSKAQIFGIEILIKVSAIEILIKVSSTE